MPDKKVDETEVEESGYAVYDNTLLKFISGVFEKKADAEKAKKDAPQSHKVEVRKV